MVDALSQKEKVDNGQHITRLWPMSAKVIAINLMEQVIGLLVISNDLVEYVKLAQMDHVELATFM